MKTKLLAFCAVALAVTGCHTPSMNTVENAQKSGQKTMVSDQRVITDSKLNKTVNIVGVNTAMTPGGVLKVQVELFNNTRSTKRFDYHFEWFDQSGMQVNGIMSAEQTDQVEGGESKFVAGIAPSTACKDFRLKLSEAP